MMWTKSALLVFFVVATSTTRFVAAEPGKPEPEPRSLPKFQVPQFQPVQKGDDGDDGASSFIINGEDASVGQYPYYVHMRIETNDGTYSCGGSLIAPDVILSAAHCNDPYFPGTDETGYVGATRYFSTANGAVLGRCVEWRNHPDFVPGQFFFGFIIPGTSVLGGNDFALCKLASPVTIDKSNVYLELNADPLMPVVGDVTESMGMGLISPDRTQGTDVLKRTDLPFLDSTTCDDSIGSIDSTMLCTLGIGNRGVCSGDSGGPIVVATREPNGKTKHTQVGVVSWGVGNCGGTPDVHAKVSAGMDWIVPTVCDDFGSQASFCPDRPTASPTCIDEPDTFTFNMQMGSCSDFASMAANRGRKWTKRLCKRSFPNNVQGLVSDKCKATCASVGLGPCVVP